ncbi:MAG: hypothetical protein ABIF09_04355, partial [Gemmatimonadota bacterium]
DVTVNDGVRVGVVQTIRNPFDYSEGVLNSQLTLVGDPIPEGLSIHERHHVEEEPRRFAGIEKGKDVWVV